MKFFKQFIGAIGLFLLTWIPIILITTGFKFNDSFTNQLIYITIMIGLPMVLITAYVFRLIDESEKTKTMLQKDVIFFLTAFFYGMTFLFGSSPAMLLDDLLFFVTVGIHVLFWLIVFTQYAMNEK